MKLVSDPLEEALRRATYGLHFKYTTLELAESSRILAEAMRAMTNRFVALGEWRIEMVSEYD